MRFIPRFRFQEAQCERGLSHLARPADEDHLFGKVILNRFLEVSADWQTLHISILDNTLFHS
jgi:hypothetical protein